MLSVTLDFIGYILGSVLGEGRGGGGNGRTGTSVAPQCHLKRNIERNAALCQLISPVVGTIATQKSVSRQKAAMCFLSFFDIIR